MFGKLTGNDDVHRFPISDLYIINLKISNHTKIKRI